VVAAAIGCTQDEAQLTIIASDIFGGANTCGGVVGHAGICFLPYP